MTILSKKKSAQGKTDQETSDVSSHHSGHQLTGSTSTQGSEYNPVPGQLSPGHRWSPSHRGEENPLSNEGNHDNTHRKRQRASPHRVVRSKRERLQPSSSPPSSTSVSTSTTALSPALNPVPDPSGGPADPSGYNSGDEYYMDSDTELTDNQWIEKDNIFSKRMQKKGFVIKEMGRDGACLFRAVADQVYGDQEMHAIVRKHCMDYIERNKDHFSQYVTEDFNMYVDRKRKASVHGNHIELQALCEMYNRPVQVFCYKIDPINIFHGMVKTDNEPIRLSYERGSHYNSIVDPHKATVGVGLGLPGFKPGLAEHNLMADAVQLSENFEIEQAMLKDKIFATDLEATDLAIEEQVARASYLEWLHETEKQSKAKLSSSPASATVTSSSPRSRSHGGSPVPLSPRSSPKAGSSSAPDVLYYQSDGALPGTSKASETYTSSSASQYHLYEAGPSTSSYQANNTTTRNNSPPHTLSSSNSRSPQRNNTESVQNTSKSSEDYVYMIQQIGNPDLKYLFGKEVMKHLRGKKRTPSSSPKNHGGSSD